MPTWFRRQGCANQGAPQGQVHATPARPGEVRYFRLTRTHDRRQQAALALRLPGEPLGLLAPARFARFFSNVAARASVSFLVLSRRRRSALSAAFDLLDEGQHLRAEGHWPDDSVVRPTRRVCPQVMGRPSVPPLRTLPSRAAQGPAVTEPGAPHWQRPRERPASR